MAESNVKASHGRGEVEKPLTGKAEWIIRVRTQPMAGQDPHATEASSLCQPCMSWAQAKFKSLWCLWRKQIPKLDIKSVTRAVGLTKDCRERRARGGEPFRRPFLLSLALQTPTFLSWFQI